VPGCCARREESGWVSSSLHLVLMPVWAVVGLLILVIGLRLHAFLALLLVSITVGLASGMSPEKVLDAAELGMGSTVGFIAVIVALGSMFSAMLESSGGAQVLARTLIGAVGMKHASWALALTGFIIGLSVFFSVGFILLVPLIYSLARETKQPLLRFALPVVSALAVTHAFLPPHPGPMAVAKILHAEPGKVILYGCLAGLPVIFFTGVFVSDFLSKHVFSPPAPPVEKVEGLQEGLPSFWLVLALVLLPVTLIVANTMTHSFARDTFADRLFVLLGHPFVALSLGALLAFLFLGRMRGLSALQIQALADQSLKPGGQIVLVVGAGGIFKQILQDSGSGQALADLLSGTGLSPLLLAFTLAFMMRLSVGSSTVSMMTAASLVNPMLASAPHLEPALVCLAIACGATACSHVNDSGFWMVKQYLGLTVSETLKSWTVITAVVGFTGILMVLLIDRLVRQ
jgi:Gnt-I system low-affinity gluconate transporter